MNFRKYILKSGREIFAGRNAESNDRLVKSAKRNDLMLHTQSPGSPFVNVGEKPGKKDISEAAVFCAKYSQEWRDRKGDLIVNSFRRSEMKKGLLMERGTWKVKKKKKIKVKKSEILKFEKKLEN